MRQYVDLDQGLKFASFCMLFLLLLRYFTAITVHFLSICEWHPECTAKQRWSRRCNCISQTEAGSQTSQGNLIHAAGICYAQRIACSDSIMVSPWPDVPLPVPCQHRPARRVGESIRGATCTHLQGWRFHYTDAPAETSNDRGWSYSSLVL